MSRWETARFFLSGHGGGGTLIFHHGGVRGWNSLDPRVSVQLRNTLFTWVSSGISTAGIPLYGMN